MISLEMSGKSGELCTVAVKQERESELWIKK